ncbi:6-phosphogluconolactonase [Prochlorococcus sp. MIT 1223]|uniref:6-phosphogluconolactonase n=1 Tax=Prochlorococcus sp. MIT 1223 TaxID=3096217 RepID=UPI002A758692|nr:6-phosphogluconolactonase [Prochlorococcus sp. MIT 1223]
MSNYRIIKVGDKIELANKATDLIVENIQSNLQEKRRVQISLSGGSTPLSIYKLLSKKLVPWERIDVFLGDERWVPENHELSNALMVKNSLLSSYPGEKASFYSVPTTELKNPQASAEFYEKLLMEKCSGDPPIFDLMLLGLGEDGHTASLFPYTDSLEVNNRWTTVSTGNNQERITLTHPVISASKKVIFLVSGSSKQIALKRLIDPLEDPNRTPSKLIKPLSCIDIIADQSSAMLI